MTDRYDVAIAYLRERPGEIELAWDCPSDHPAGALFQFANESGLRETRICGCLTQIRAGKGAVAPEVTYHGYPRFQLTEAIRKDERIPTRPEDITVDSLEAFAEWQRRLDVALERQERRS